MRSLLHRRRHAALYLSVGVLIALGTTFVRPPESSAAAPPPPAPAAAPIAAAPPLVVQSLTIERGDTLAARLHGAGVEDAETPARAVTAVFPPRELKPGQELSLRWARAPEAAAPGRLAELSLTVSPALSIHALPDGDTFEVTRVEHPLTPRLRHAHGRIDDSLYVAGRAAGIPPNALVRMIRVLSFDVDFQRDLRRGDRFELLYEELVDESGAPAGTGELLYVALELSGRRLALTRFVGTEGRAEFFDDKGRSARKTLMRTPIDGARLTSGFGRRRHPVLGYSKVHRGIDFAAPVGTPIYAAGDGVVEKAGWFGTYGRYVRIRHNASYKTAYAHLSRIAKGIRPGVRVQQGAVIGKLGASGRVTGPHLHYEVLVGGKHVNPLNYVMDDGLF